MKSPKSRGNWTWVNSVVAGLLLVNLCALTWYLWKIPTTNQFDTLEKTISTVTGWIASALGFFGIKHTIRKKLSMAHALALRPVQFSTVVLTVGVWLFIYPFHSITLYVRGGDAKPLAGATATIDRESARRIEASDEQGQLKIRGLLACSHNILLEKAGYKPRPLIAGFADVLAMGKLHPEPLEKLETPEGTVRLRTDPPGAAIYVDGDPETVGPTEKILSLPAGKHKITMNMPGYERVVDEVTVSAGTPLELPVRKLRALPSPPPRTYPLVVTSDPADAEIYVNAKFQGKTPSKLWLPAGQHKIELRKTGYESARGLVSIPAQKIFTPWESLKKLGEH